MKEASERIPNLKEFYQFYLSEHLHPVSRTLHFIGTFGVIVLLILSFYFMDWRFFVTIPFCGYGFAWIGHFFFEKNKPATFQYPLWSLCSDFILFWHLLIGKQKFDSRK
ncbi:DUF962 domain-containing protein [Xanthovirga aplysinae]|uniref:DUF962 domain-containing protein n=1 Tax=Xanthovirga aplysinae TaxID=2529853 RepID=UPI0012BCD3AF|nr:DUF962 domain-containing protein [Xanthovirga aplysinae]MTI30192.1 DUF962 domain-containing protein [Xanthovirga aplysinae]